MNQILHSTIYADQFGKLPHNSTETVRTAIFLAQFQVWFLWNIESFEVIANRKASSLSLGKILVYTEKNILNIKKNKLLNHMTKKRALL